MLQRYLIAHVWAKYNENINRYFEIFNYEFKYLIYYIFVLIYYYSNIIIKI